MADPVADPVAEKKGTPRNRIAMITTKEGKAKFACQSSKGRELIGDPDTQESKWDKRWMNHNHGAY